MQTFCFMKKKKAISKKGKETLLYETFRDEVAKPYLDKKYGIACKDCGILPPMKDDGTYYRHDVDHVKNRGSHHELKFQVTNLVYRCRKCHSRKTDGKNV